MEKPAEVFCKARRSTDPPQDCDWPTCGCDPAADKVIEALIEADKLPHEVCICAAIRTPAGRIIRGQRHYDCLRTAMAIPGVMPDDVRTAEQGFVTSRNRFVDRQQGLQLQLAAGIQSAADGYRGNLLFSEDLY